MSAERNESVVLQQFKRESAIRLDLVRAARNRGAPSGYLTPMIEVARREAQSVADGERGELRAAAQAHLLDLWAEEGEGLDSRVKSLGRAAAIRLAVVRDAKEHHSPQAFRREMVRQARTLLEASVKDEQLHPEERKAAAIHLAELQVESGKFFAARRALKFGLTDGKVHAEFSPARIESLKQHVEHGINDAHLLREFRELRDQDRAKRTQGIKSALAKAQHMEQLAERAEMVPSENRVIVDLAREEQGRWLVEAAKKAAKRGERQQAKELVERSLASFDHGLKSTDPRLATRARFDASRAHLLMARLTRDARDIELARRHSSAITRRLPVSSVKKDTLIDRRELRTLRQQLTVTEKQLAKLPSNRIRSGWMRLTTPVVHRLNTMPKPVKLRSLVASCVAIASSFTLMSVPADQWKLAFAHPNHAPIQQSLAAPVDNSQALLIAADQAKLGELVQQRAALEDQLQAATADYQTKKQIDDSLTGCEGVARAVRKAGMANRVLGVATSAAESTCGASKFSGWTDEQGNEHVRVEPNGTVGIGAFQESVPAGDFNAQTPYVVGLENNLDVNAQHAQDSHVGPNGGRFTSYCADYTPGHCMQGAYYLAPGSPVLRFIPTAQQAVADEQAKYNAEVAAEASVDAIQAQIPPLNTEINQTRVELRQLEHGVS